MAWNVPSRPVMPCTMTRVFLSAQIAIYIVPLCGGGLQPADPAH